MSMHVDRSYSMAIDRLGESFGRRPHTIYASDETRRRDDGDRPADRSSSSSSEDLREHGDARFIRNICTARALRISGVVVVVCVFSLSMQREESSRPLRRVGLALERGRPSDDPSIDPSLSLHARWIDRRHRRRWNREKPAERT
jgi:hypothetical protein